jgi:hypothetical protein
MARVHSTARVDREGDETEATETVPISEAMKRSGLEREMCPWAISKYFGD